MSRVLPDVNVLVYAFGSHTTSHELYRDWLAAVVTGGGLALDSHVLTGFVRVSTNPEIPGPTASTADAMAFLEPLTAARGTRWLTSGRRTWERFAQLVADDPAIRGKRVPDAYLAALAITNGVRVATADRVFRRYPGVDWFDPAA